MEVKNLGYSLNNIPIPAKQHCLKSMIDKVAIVQKVNGPKLDRLSKEMISLFKDERLSITINDFLDVTFNLYTGKYFLFTKRNNTSLYIFKIQLHTINYQPITINDQQNYFKLILWRN